LKRDLEGAVPHAADLEDIAPSRKLGEVKLPVRAGNCRYAASEKRDLNLSQRLAALGIGDDAANVGWKSGNGQDK